jgi:hypothetical protein
MRYGIPAHSDWFGRAAEHAARFGLDRNDDPVFVACDQFFLESAAAAVEQSGERCWSRLELPRLFEAVGAYESPEVMALAIETLAAFYAWLVAAGELRLERVAPILDGLADALASGSRAVVRRRVLPPSASPSAVPREEAALSDGARVGLPHAPGRANVAA